MKTLDTNVKNLFELQVLKKLMEDNFISLAGGDVSPYNAITLAEHCFDIASMQGYGNFSTAYRSQLINALGEILSTYSDVCRRYEELKAKYPEENFVNLGGLGVYEYRRDGLNGCILKISTDVRAGVDCRIPGKPEHENIISVSFYVLDKYNYNYRTAALDRWEIRNNLLVWKDIVQGNALLNFILTLPRSAAIPMRTVSQYSTRQMVKPIPTPPPPPAPYPYPYPPVPGPVPPPGPYPFPPPGPAPYPFPPVPPAPPPPPPPHDCIIQREVIAARTLGGINKGDILPVGLSFTQFAEWLLHGSDGEVSPTIRLTISDKTLNLEITDRGTSTPTSILFYQTGDDVALFETEFVEGQMVYTLLVDPPYGTTEYYAVLKYNNSKVVPCNLESNDVSITIEEPVREDYIYFGAKPNGVIPTAEDILAGEALVISDNLLENGIRFRVPTQLTVMYLAIPISYIREGKNEYAGTWLPPQLFASDGATPEAYPTREPIDIAIDSDANNYRLYVWDTPFVLPLTYIMAKNDNWK